MKGGRKGGRKGCAQVRRKGFVKEERRVKEGRAV
jgi:hypothetical protein